MGHREAIGGHRWVTAQPQGSHNRVTEGSQRGLGLWLGLGLGPGLGLGLGLGLGITTPNPNLYHSFLHLHPYPILHPSPNLHQCPKCLHFQLAGFAFGSIRELLDL